MASMPETPDPDRIAADERRIGELLRSVEAPAPGGLHHRIAARNQRRPWWQSAPAFGLAIAGAASAACVALVLALTSGPGAPAPPTVLRAALVALDRPTAPAPPALVATGTRISFPNQS